MIRTLQAHLPVFAVTHAGMSGKNNEDRYAVSAYLLSEEDPTPAVFAVLADGIGGHRAGEVASEMAVEVISQQVAASDGRSPLETLTAAIHLASQQIYAAAQAGEARQPLLAGAKAHPAAGLGQRLGMGAEKLDELRRPCLAAGDHLQGAAVAAAQPLGGDHLRHQQAAAADLVHETAQGVVGQPGHRGQDERGIDGGSAESQHAVRGPSAAARRAG